MNDDLGTCWRREAAVRSSILKQQLRKMDMVCRYGGDEFAIVVPETTGESAVRVAEKTAPPGGNAFLPRSASSGDHQLRRGDYPRTALPVMKWWPPRTARFIKPSSRDEIKWLQPA